MSGEGGEKRKGSEIRNRRYLCVVQERIRTRFVHALIPRKTVQTINHLEFQKFKNEWRREAEEKINCRFEKIDCRFEDVVLPFQ